MVSTALNSAFELVSKDLEPAQQITLANGLKSNAREFLDFAIFIERLKTDDYYSRMELESPAEYIALFLEWEKRRSRNNDLKVLNNTLENSTSEVLNKSHDRFVVQSENLWSQEGGSGSVKDIVALMKKFGNGTKESSLATLVRKLLVDKKLIGIKENEGEKSSWRIPRWQINRKTGSPFGEIQLICKVFDDNGFSVLDFMLTNDLPSLTSRPIDMLGHNQERKILEAAKEFQHVE